MKILNEWFQHKTQNVWVYLSERRKEAFLESVLPSTKRCQSANYHWILGIMCRKASSWHEEDELKFIRRMEETRLDMRAKDEI